MGTRPAPNARRALAAVCATLCATLLTGCAFRSPAAADRCVIGEVVPVAPDAWPARETALLPDMVSVTPKRLKFAFPVSVMIDGRLTTVNATEPMEVVEQGVYGRGIVRAVRPVDSSDDANAGGESPAAQFAQAQEMLGYLQFASFAPDPNAVRVASVAPEDSGASRYRRYLWRRLGIRPGRGGEPYLVRAGTRMRLFEPTTSTRQDGESGEERKSEVARRGIVIHLSSLAGLDYERSVIDELTMYGWTVLQIDASTARHRDPPVHASVDDDPAAPAERLAEIIDNRVAEIAYAAEAGLDYIGHLHPELAHAPVAVAGYSAGALVAPTVAALLHNRVGAVVIVGGGADLLDIARRSSLTNGGIRVQWDRPPAESDWRRLEDAYLAASSLDPYRTAPALVDKPVLMLHALLDDIIPADTGDLLYERLGRPERLSFPLGHRGLFWRLPTQAGTITRWLDEEIEPVTQVTSREREDGSPESGR